MNEPEALVTQPAEYYRRRTAQARRAAGGVTTAAAIKARLLDLAFSPRTLPIAPDFKAIANTPATTATSLRVFLATSHPKMPNLILTQQQSADVIACILSLRDRR
jgi:hypothetical protein